MKRCPALLLLLAVACRTAPNPQPAPLPAPSHDDRGAVGAKMLSDPGGPSLRLGPGEEYVPPQFTPGNPMPEYPPELIRLRLKPHVVSVRMVVDECRRITDISASPLQASTQSVYRTEFEEAVRAALEQWSVWPPAIRKFKPGPDANGDGKADYQILVDELTLKAYFDFAFTFELVDGRAVIKTSMAQP